MYETVQQLLCDYKETNNVDKLIESNKLIQSYFNSWKLGQPFNFPAGLLLLAGAYAIKEDEKNMAISILRIYEEVYNTVDENMVMFYFLRIETLLFGPSSKISLDVVTQYTVKAITTAKELRKDKLIENACLLFYRAIKPYSRYAKRLSLIKHLKTLVKLLVDSEFKVYRWLVLFLSLLFDAHLQAGNRKDAIQVLDTVVGGPARHIPADMIQFLVRGSRANMPSAERIISWALGVGGGTPMADVEPPSTQPEKAASTASTPKTSTERWKRESQVQMSGWLAQTLTAKALAPMNQIAKIRISNRNTEEHLNDMVRLLRNLSNPDDSMNTNENMRVDSSKKPDDNSGEPTESWEGRAYEPDANLQALLDLGNLALDRCVPGVGEMCVSAAAQLLACEQQQVTDPGSGAFLLDLLRMRLRMALECFPVQNEWELYMKPQRQIMIQCQQRFEHAMKQKLNTEAIQVGCVVLWDLCLPSFRRYTLQDRVLRKSLQLVVDGLERIDSLHYRLRCQAHWMLARFLAAEEQLPQALVHLEKAFHFDDTDEFSEGMIHLYHRLQLRANLYEVPTRREDAAAQILEHLQSVDPTDFSTHKLSLLFKTYFKWQSDGVSPLSGLLSKVGELLAPDKFFRALEMESKLIENLSSLAIKSEKDESCSPGVSSGPQETSTMWMSYSLDTIRQLAQRAKLWSDSTALIAEDTKTGLETMKSVKESIFLWKDLALNARRFKLWDICLLACRLCLQYDKEEYWMTLLNKLDTEKKPTKGKENQTAQRSSNKETTEMAVAPAGLSASDVILTARASEGDACKPSVLAEKLREQFVPSAILNYHELELLYSLAGIQCLLGESLSMLLRNQPGRLSLACLPGSPVSEDDDGNQSDEQSQLTDEQLQSMPEEQQKMRLLETYRSWLIQISDMALAAFRRCAVLTVKMKDIQLFRMSATCVWNHCLPAICTNDHRQLIATFQNILECATKLGPNTLPLEQHAELSIILAHGLIQPWLPTGDIKLRLKSAIGSNLTARPGDSDPKKRPSKSPKQAAKGSGKHTVHTVPQEGQANIKKAGEWLLNAAELVYKSEESSLFVDPNQPNFTIQQRPTKPLTLNTRSRLVHLWMVTRQLSAGTPTYRYQFPCEAPVDTSAANEEKDLASETAARQRSLGNMQDNISTTTLVTKALLAVYAVWSTNQTHVLLEWPSVVCKLTKEPRQTAVSQSSHRSNLPLAGFKDACTTAEAIKLMTLAFYLPSDQSPEPVELNQLNDSTEAPEMIATTQPVSRERRMTLTSTDRGIELQLWSNLAQCALVAEQYSQVLEITELASLQDEFTRAENRRYDPLVSQLLNLRGLAVLGIADQHRAQLRTESNQGKGKKSRETENKIEPVHTLVCPNEILIAAGGSITSSFFAAAEESFFRAAEFGARSKRYDILLVSVKYYWNICNCLELIPAPDVLGLVYKVDRVREHCTQLNHWLVTGLDGNQRSQLNAAIRAQQKSGTDDALVTAEECEKPFAMDIVNSLYEHNAPSATPSLIQFEEELRIRMEIYCVLFDLHILKKNPNAGLFLLTEALQRFPRTRHRMPLFQRLVTTKAKLGQSVRLEMQKFSREPEEAQAELWRTVAHTSRKSADQFLAFRSAVSVLKTEKNRPLKAEILMEFAQWLFVQRADAGVYLAILEEAIDLLLLVPIESTPITLRIEMTKSSKSLRSARRSGQRTLQKDQQNLLSVPPRRIEYHPLRCIDLANNVCQLDALMRGCLLMAELQRSAKTDDKENWTDYIWMSVACVRRIWTLIISSAGAASQVLRKHTTNEVETPKSHKSAQTKGKPSNNEGQSRGKSSTDQLPRTINQWAVYSVSEELLQLWQAVFDLFQTELEPSVTEPTSVGNGKGGRSEQSGKSREPLSNLVEKQINSNTIKSPLLTVSSLTRLAELITEMGAAQHAFPILVLQEALTRPAATTSSSRAADLISRTSSSNQLAKLQLLELCCCLNLTEGIEHYQVQLNGIGPIEQDIADFLAKARDSHEDNTQVTSIILNNWIQLADRLTRLGQGSAARSYLEAVERFTHSTVSHQKRLLFIKAQLALTEGQHHLARTLLGKATELDPSDEHFFMECFLLRMEALCADPELAARQLSDDTTTVSTTVSQARVHFGQQAAAKEASKLMDKVFPHRADVFPSRRGWFERQTAILASRLGQLESRLAESCSELKLINNTYTPAEQPDDVTKLVESNDTLQPCPKSHVAPMQFERAIQLLSANDEKRSALRLGWLPLHAYWLRCLKTQETDYLIQLRNEFIHPAVHCTTFKTTLECGEHCVEQSEQLVLETESTSTVHELEHCQLPIHRDAMEAQFGLVNVLLTVMRTHAAYERVRIQRDRAQEPLARAVTVFTKSSGAPPCGNLSVEEIKHWEETVKNTFNRITSLLSNIYGNSDKLPFFRTRCLFFIAEAFRLQADSHLPDGPTRWLTMEQVAKLKSNGDADPTVSSPNLDNDGLGVLECDKLHSGFPYRIRNDLFVDLKIHESATELYTKATQSYLTALQLSLSHNWVGLARTIFESLAECIGGNTNDHVLGITQSILHGLQSCAATCRLRTQLLLINLLSSSTAATGEIKHQFGYQTRGAKSALETLLLQLSWLCPSTPYATENLSVAYGLCAVSEPQSCLESLAWATGIHVNLLNGRFLSTGGLAAGPDEHCVDGNPWIGKLVAKLSATCTAWKATELNLSSVLDPIKSLSSAVASFTGATANTSRIGEIVLMEHSGDGRYLYVSVPSQSTSKGGNQKTGTAKSKGGKGDSSTHFCLPTTRREIISSVWNWKRRLEQLDRCYEKRSAMLEYQTPHLFHTEVCVPGALEKVVEYMVNLWIPGEDNQPDGISTSSTTPVSLSPDAASWDETGIITCSGFIDRLCASSTLAQTGLLLLADAWLNELPLEAIWIETVLRKMVQEKQMSNHTERSTSISHSRNGSNASGNKAKKPPLTSLPFAWISRDLSYQQLHNRLTGNLASSGQKSTEAAEQSQKNTSRKPEQRAHSRHPLLRDSHTTTVKQGGHLINPTGFRLLVDPYNESSSVLDELDSAIETEPLDEAMQQNNAENHHAYQDGDAGDGDINCDTKSMGSKIHGRKLHTFAQHIHLQKAEPVTRSTQHTFGWVGLSGGDETIPGFIPSLRESLAILDETCNGLMAYMAESFATFLPPETLLNVPLTNCNFACLFDRIHTPTSVLRKSRENCRKSAVAREMEQPLCTLTSLTLAGCRSVLLPQWTTNMPCLQARMEHFLKQSLDDGHIVGQSALLAQLHQLSDDLRASYTHQYTSRMPSQDKIGTSGRTRSTDLCEQKTNDDNPGFPIESLSSIQFGLPIISFK